jgi:hypothetical protein
LGLVWFHILSVKVLAAVSVVVVVLDKGIALVIVAAVGDDDDCVIAIIDIVANFIVVKAAAAAVIIKNWQQWHFANFQIWSVKKAFAVAAAVAAVVALVNVAVAGDGCVDYDVIDIIYAVAIFIVGKVVVVVVAAIVMKNGKHVHFQSFNFLCKSDYQLLLLLLGSG